MAKSYDGKTRHPWIRFRWTKQVFFLRLFSKIFAGDMRRAGVDSDDDKKLSKKFKSVYLVDFDARSSFFIRRCADLAKVETP